MQTLYDKHHCTLCPRKCGADRTTSVGVCGAGDDVRIAKTMLHRFEEPPISGTRGSGAIFFCGCNLRCGYCQNAAISHGQAAGAHYTVAQLADSMLALQASGAHNINLVTAAHYLPQVVQALQSVKPHLSVPVVYNSSGYEKATALRLLDGLVDIYLPDFKYLDASAARRYSAAADYPTVAMAAIEEMLRQTGEYREKDGLAVRGTVIRHLVLPGLSADSAAIMRTVARQFPAARVSIMRQYTPSFNRTGDRALDRKVTALEYNRVVDAAIACGLTGFTQERDSATDIYTPDFT